MGTAYWGWSTSTIWVRLVRYAGTNHGGYHGEYHGNIMGFQGEYHREYHGGCHVKAYHGEYHGGYHGDTMGDVMVALSGNPKKTLGEPSESLETPFRDQ